MFVSTETKLLVTVHFDLSSIVLSPDQVYNLKGRKRYPIDLVLVVNPENDEGMMQVSVEYNGSKCGSSQFQMEFADE